MTAIIKRPGQPAFRREIDNTLVRSQQGVYPWGECVQLERPAYTVYSRLFFNWLKERAEDE